MLVLSLFLNGSIVVYKTSVSFTIVFLYEAVLTQRAKLWHLKGLRITQCSLTFQLKFG